nr:hypothetical protein [Actinomycetota bacterium]
MNAHAVVIEQGAGRRLMSTFHAMFSVGTFIGGIIGGVLSQFEVSLLSQAAIFAALYLVLAFVIKSLLLPASIDQHPITKEKKAKSPIIFWVFGIFGLFAALSEGAAGDWGGVLARDTFDATPFVSTLPFIFFTLAMVIGRFSGDYLAHRFGASKVIASGGSIAGIGLALGLLVGGIPMLMLAWFLPLPSHRPSFWSLLLWFRDRSAADWFLSGISRTSLGAFLTSNSYRCPYSRGALRQSCLIPRTI